MKDDNALLTSIDGSWNLVSDNPGNDGRNGTTTQFKMFHDGHFSFIGKITDGRVLAGAGTYTLDGNSYKETFEFCTLPEYIGTKDEQTCYLKNDTLYFKGFTKVIKADGKDITDSFPKFEEIRVRAK